MKHTSILRTLSKLCQGVVVAGLASAALPSLADCIQDAYGNQYFLNFDTVHQTITGNAKMVQCDGAVWALVGSYSGANFNRRQQTIAFANSNDAPNCQFGPFMLKGKYPNYAWYYTYGYGGQDGKFVACTTGEAPASLAGQGARR